MNALCSRRLPGVGRECRTVLVLTTDGLGRVSASCQRCQWRAVGRCWQCGIVRDTGARAVYCSRCAAHNKIEAGRRYERSPSAQKAARERERRRNQTEERRAWRRQWTAANPDKVKQYKRRQALNPTPRRKEREAWHNARPERIAAKREQAKRRYYELHPHRPQPICRTCQQPIPWTPPGRPPVRCDGCVPANILAKRKRTNERAAL